MDDMDYGTENGAYAATENREGQNSFMTSAGISFGGADTSLEPDARDAAPTAAQAADDRD